MKKAFAFIIALALVLTGAVAFAAGETVIWMQGEDHAFSTNNAVISNGTLYLFSFDGNYMLWRDGQGADDILSLDLPQDSYDNDENIYYNHYFFGSDDGIYLLSVENISNYDEEEDYYSGEVGEITLSRLVPDDDGVLTVEATDVEIDADDMIDSYDADNEYFMGMNYPGLVDGQLVFTTYGDNGECLGVYDLETGEGGLYEVENLHTWFKFGDKIGVGLYGYEEDSTYQVAVFDPETEETETITENIPIENWQTPTGLTYDETNNSLCYVQSGVLNVMPLDGGETTEVGAISASSWDIQTSAVLGDSFIYVTYDRAVARTTDPALKAERRLTVCSDYSTASEKAVVEFGSAHPEIDIVKLDSYMDISDAMLNQSSTIDVYTISSTEFGYEALKEKGYMAALNDSEAITAFTNALYPSMQDLVKNGENVCAVPVDNYINVWGYNPQALEEMGWTEDDLPKTYVELIDLLARAEEIHEEYPRIYVFDPYYTPEDLRSNLINMVVTDYLTYMHREGETSFDSADLREVLEKIEELDMESIALMEDYDDWDVNFDYDYPLLTQWAYVALNTNHDTWQKPMPLAFGDGEPVINETYSLIFVNPYSENIDLATEYVETVISFMDEERLTSLMPEKNEPIVNPYFEENKQWYEEYIETLNESIENAETDEDREMFENELADYEQYYNDFVENEKFTASAEDIEWFRNIQYKATPSVAFFADETASTEFNDVLMQYMDGSITLDEFINTIDKKFRMMLMEDM